MSEGFVSRHLGLTPKGLWEFGFFCGGRTRLSRCASLFEAQDGLYIYLKRMLSMTVNSNQMTVEERLKRLAGYNLADPVPDSDVLRGAVSLRRKRSLDDDIAEFDAAVAAGGIVAFVNGASAQNKRDVLNTFMFARLAASYEFDSKLEGDRWYGLFSQVMLDLGWVGFKSRYTRYTATERRFTMEQAGLKILASAIAAASMPGPAALAMLTVAEDAVKALQESKEAVGLFERQTKDHRDADFAMASCIQLAGNDLVMAMGSVHMKANTNVTNVLLTEWQSSSVSVMRAEDTVTLNRSAFNEEVSLELIGMLGGHTKKSLKKYKISK
jgi:hypothetical protein